MLVIGLTGGMGAGKSTIARLFRARHIPVFDADRTVHRLQARGGRAVAPIAALWPDAVVGQAASRSQLRDIATRSSANMQALEAIMHPLVAEERQFFLRLCQRRAVPLCVLDIPLLFEAGGARDCDLVLVAHAPREIRRARVARRRGVSTEQAEALMARQMPDAQRLSHADLIVPTGLSRREAQARVARLLAALYDCAP